MSKAGRRQARNMASSRHPVLTFDQLYEGHDETVRNAERPFEAGTGIFKEYPDISLGLYELGQEEIGKSFSFLAAFGYGPSDPGWRDFWVTWRDHRRKAYRAFFYEWLSPVRFVVSARTGSTLDGFSRKASIEREKESAFYVDFLPVTRRFVSPGEQTDAYEAANRSASLISLVVTASYVKIALDNGDKTWNYMTFSEIPILILTRFTRQENMPAILDRFADRSDRHRLLVESLRSALRGGAEWLRSLDHVKGAAGDVDEPTEEPGSEQRPPG